MNWICEKCGHHTSRADYICPNCEDGRPKWYQQHGAAQREIFIKHNIKWDTDLGRELSRAFELMFTIGRHSICDQLISQLGLDAGR